MLYFILYTFFSDTYENVFWRLRSELNTQQDSAVLSFYPTLLSVGFFKQHDITVHTHPVAVENLPGRNLGQWTG